MAAFDFGSKVDPILFDKHLNAFFSLNVREYIGQAGNMFREHVGEFAGFTLIMA
jgi:hypothetical protein